VILYGRAYDPVAFAAPAIAAGYDESLALHMGKILECAAIAATPGSGADCVMGILEEDAFVLEALSPSRRFTATSAAAHTLYEKVDPYSLPGPGGTLDLSECRFEEMEGGRVRVSGSRHVTGCTRRNVQSEKVAGSFLMPRRGLIEDRGTSRVNGPTAKKQSPPRLSRWRHASASPPGRPAPRARRPRARL